MRSTLGLCALLLCVGCSDDGDGSSKKKAALVEFMKTLTGAAVPASLLADTSK